MYQNRVVVEQSLCSCLYICPLQRYIKPTELQSRMNRTYRMAQEHVRSGEFKKMYPDRDLLKGDIGKLVETYLCGTGRSTLSQRIKNLEGSLATFVGSAREKEYRDALTAMKEQKADVRPPCVIEMVQWMLEQWASGTLMSRFRIAAGNFLAKSTLELSVPVFAYLRCDGYLTETDLERRKVLLLDGQDDPARHGGHLPAFVRQRVAEEFVRQYEKFGSGALYDDVDTAVASAADGGVSLGMFLQLLDEAGLNKAASSFRDIALRVEWAGVSCMQVISGRQDVSMSDIRDAISVPAASRTPKQLQIVASVIANLKAAAQGSKDKPLLRAEALVTALTGINVRVERQPQAAVSPRRSEVSSQQASEGDTIGSSGALALPKYNIRDLVALKGVPYELQMVPVFVVPKDTVSVPVEIMTVDVTDVARLRDKLTHGLKKLEPKMKLVFLDLPYGVLGKHANHSWDKELADVDVLEALKAVYDANATKRFHAVVFSNLQQIGRLAAALKQGEWANIVADVWDRAWLKAPYQRPAASYLYNQDVEYFVSRLCVFFFMVT